MNIVLQYQGLLYIPKINQARWISYYYDDLFADNFGINKTFGLVNQKYYCSTLCKDKKAYV